MQDAVELHERLLVKRDVVEFLRRDAAFAQAILDGVPRKSRVVLLSRETFLLRGGDDLPITHQARGAVVVVGRKAKDIDVRI